MARSQFNRMFQQVAYGVAIRKLGDTGAFAMKYPTAFHWYADPFVVNDNGRHYVFVESMNSYHLDGEIAVAPVENDKIGEFQTIIHEPYHMSFPNVFKWENDWYMLPEISMSKQVRLYKAEAFPYQWKLDKILLKNVKLVDHALYPIKNGFFVVTHDNQDKKHVYNRFFVLDMQKKQLKEYHPAGTWTQERPGGNFFLRAGQWYHVTQDCQHHYGEYLHFYRVDNLSRENFNETEVKTVHIHDIIIEPDNKKMQFIHTYNCDDKYEVIDVRYDKIYPDKFFIHQWHEILKRIKGRKH